MHTRCRDSNHVCTCQWHVHEPVRTLANTFIVFSRFTQGKRRCMRIPYSAKDPRRSNSRERIPYPFLSPPHAGQKPAARHLSRKDQPKIPQALKTRECRKSFFMAGIRGNEKTAKSFSVPINHFTMGKQRRARMKRSHHLARRPEKPVYGEKPTKNGHCLRRISSIRVT